MNNRSYETYTLPQYVRDYFGPPVILKRIGVCRFACSGENRTVRFDAENVADARNVLKEMAQYALQPQDRRIKPEKSNINTDVERAIFELETMRTNRGLSQFDRDRLAVATKLMSRQQRQINHLRMHFRSQAENTLKMLED